MTAVGELGRALRLVCDGLSVRNCGIDLRRVSKSGVWAVEFVLRDYVLGSRRVIALVGVADQQAAAVALLAEMAAMRKEEANGRCESDAARRGAAVDSACAGGAATAAA